MIVAGGTVGSVLTGDPRLILGALGYVGAESLATSPRFRSALANRLYLLSEKDFKKLEGGVTFTRGVPEIKPSSLPIFRRAVYEAAKIWGTPEGRLAIRGMGKIDQVVQQLQKEFENES
jgi:hypothetical protein